MRCYLVPLCLLLSAAFAWTQSDGGKTKELEQFQGSWAAVSIQGIDGRLTPTEDVAETRLLVTGNKFTLSGKAYSISGDFSIDPSKTPKTIDLVLNENQVSETKLLGIYDIKGDIRKSCFSVPGRPRPTTFMHGKENYLIFEWKAQRH